MVASEVVRTVATQRHSTDETQPPEGRAWTSLGRGLEGILGDAFVAGADSGLLQLLGAHHTEPARQLRQFVADTAVGVVAAKFGGRAVWLASVDSSASADLVSTHLPPRWSHTSPSSLEISGRLWQSLSVAAGTVQACIGGEHVLICSQRFDDSSFAVAVVRSEAFSPGEQQTLSRFLRSVSVAITGTRPELAGIEVDVSVQQGHQTACAEVSISLGAESRKARCEASSAPLATAQAAASICDVSCTVAYAGQVSLQEHAVNMVVVLDETDAPLIGLSVLPLTDLAGPARAVFSSLVSVAGQPFARVGPSAGPGLALPVKPVRRGR